MNILLLTLSLARADVPPPPDIEPPPPAPPPVAELPDLEATAVRGQCETPPVKTKAKAAAGADQTYVGTYTMADDGSVTGVEKRLLFANEAWKASKGEDGVSGYDCVNVWNITGTRIDPTCADCTYGFQFEANIDYAKSTCPQRLVVDGNHYRGAYDVKVSGDSVQVFFHDSGKPLAKGRTNGLETVWISDHRCVWL